MSPYKGIIDSRTQIGSETPMLGVSLLQGENAILGKQGNYNSLGYISRLPIFDLMNLAPGIHVSGNLEDPPK